VIPRSASRSLESITQVGNDLTVTEDADCCKQGIDQVGFLPWFNVGNLIANAIGARLAGALIYSGRVNCNLFQLLAGLRWQNRLESFG